MRHSRASSSPGLFGELKLWSLVQTQAIRAGEQIARFARRGEI
jgi:hypothetical protein